MGDGVDALLGHARDVVNGLLGSIREAVNGLLGNSGDIVNGAESSFGDLPQRALGVVKDLGGAALVCGHQLLHLTVDLGDDKLQGITALQHHRGTMYQQT